MDFGLSGKTALVTGGAGRIGSEDCRVLAAEGATVVVLDVAAEAAETVANEIRAAGGTAHAVTCNIITPNIVMDALADLSSEELAATNPMFERIRKATPMQKLGRERDVSNLIAYLSSEQASYITGQVIGVTGGIDLFSF
ncbi:SDR family oxidoreductase [Haladaptatus sp. DJG-WS-42]|uniref:SDR family oxidoreductase n=1 Tax=Haladaptatus sp. DJG-WS-42 TaxID=3120516 RepID=UPI0030D3F29F